MRRRPAAPLLTAVLAATAVLLPAASAQAAPADKAAVLSSWTQTSAAGLQAFAAARANQGAWSAYGFDRSTDYCTTSPDNPFSPACARHDFGYRNHRAAGTFDANKARADDAFHAGLKRVCAACTGLKKTSCDATAWTYYQAVDKLG